MSFRRVLLLLLALAAVVLPSRPASAHNSLDSSDPADGAKLDGAPAEITFSFAQPVELDTYSAQYVDASGVRHELSDATHGAAGDHQVVQPLPELPAGEATVGWRLVGADGHPITGRVQFTVAEAAATTAAPPTTVASQPAGSTTVAPTTAAPTTAAAATTTTTPAAAAVAGNDGSADPFGEPWSTNDAVRWILRMVSYVAMMAVAGLIATVVYVWPRARDQPVLRAMTAWALAIAFVLALVQLLVIASDIAAAPLQESLGELSAALQTDAGLAMAARAGLLAVLGAVLFVPLHRDSRTRWMAAGGCAVSALATWAYAGHSHSMRWAFVGVPLDVAHHAAAAAWLGGLAIVGLVAMRRLEAVEVVGVAQRFSRLAATAVAVIVGTGVIQCLRLVGNPTHLFTTDHGRFLVGKFVVIALMLKLADANRRRVNLRFQRPDAATPRAASDLGRSMAIEMFAGLAVIGITAALVVSPPATANDQPPDDPPTNAQPTDAQPATEAGP